MAKTWLSKSLGPWGHGRFLTRSAWVTERLMTSTLPSGLSWVVPSRRLVDRVGVPVGDEHHQVGDGSSGLCVGLDGALERVLPVCRAARVIRVRYFPKRPWAIVGGGDECVGDRELRRGVEVDDRHLRARPCERRAGIPSRRSSPSWRCSRSSRSCRGSSITLTPQRVGRSGFAAGAVTLSPLTRVNPAGPGRGAVVARCGEERDVVVARRAGRRHVEALRRGAAVGDGRSSCRCQRNGS